MKKADRLEKWLDPLLRGFREDRDSTGPARCAALLVDLHALVFEPVLDAFRALQYDPAHATSSEFRKLRPGALFSPCRSIPGGPWGSAATVIARTIGTDEPIEGCVNIASHLLAAATDGEPGQFDALLRLLEAVS